MENILKVIEYVRANDLRLTTDEGVIITDNEGMKLFESNDKVKCFNQARAWINGNECENLH